MHFRHLVTSPSKALIPDLALFREAHVLFLLFISEWDDD